MQELNILAYGLAALIIFGCSFIQAVAGFAYALFAIPLLMLIGFSLPEAVLLSLPGSIITRLMVVYHCRRDLHFKPLFQMLPFGLAGLILGIFFLKRISTLPTESVRQIVGGLILFTVFIRLAVRIEPRDHIGTIWGILAAFFSGLLGGMANIGGPPLVLWVVAHKWSVQRTRSIVSAFSLLIAPLQIFLLWLNFGDRLFRTGMIGMLFLPIILLAVHLGNLTSTKLSADRLRMAILVLLGLIGGCYVLIPLLQSM